MAWVVLWTAFGAFCLMAVAALAGIGWYYEHALTPRPTQTRTIGGTLLARSPTDPSWVSLPAQGSLREGQTVRTDGTSQAMLTLFDYSTIVISSGTELKLTRTSVSRFTGKRHAIRLELLQGRVHIGVAPTGVPEREFAVAVAGGSVLLEEGGYTLTAEGDQGLIRIGDRGHAAVHTRQSGPVVVVSGQRVQWSAAGELGRPEAAAQELVYNGDFAWGFQGWRVGNSLGFTEGTDVEGQASLTTGANGQPVVHFQRQYSRSTHCETYLYQEINQDVSDDTNLTLTVTFQLQYQSLSGGGYLGTEYPISARVVYRAANGEEHTYFTGFYYHNTTDNRTDHGQLVPQDRWHTASIPLKSISPQPHRIVSLQVSAAGWDYHSQLQRVSLTAR